MTLILWYTLSHPGSTPVSPLLGVLGVPRRPMRNRPMLWPRLVTVKEHLYTPPVHRSPTTKLVRSTSKRAPPEFRCDVVLLNGDGANVELLVELFSRNVLAMLRPEPATITCSSALPMGASCTKEEKGGRRRREKKKRKKNREKKGTHMSVVAPTTRKEEIKQCVG